MSQAEKYNLQRLLEMRERARDDAAIRLAEARRQLQLAEDELQTRKRSVEDCRREQIEIQNALSGKSNAGIKANELARFRQYLIDLRGKEIYLLKAVEDQKQIVLREEKKVEKAFVELNEAAKELKVIEKHRENWRDESKKESTRREQKSNDETAQILHERQKFE
jgi:flagellar export protein FliJ